MSVKQGVLAEEKRSTGKRKLTILVVYFLRFVYTKHNSIHSLAKEDLIRLWICVVGRIRPHEDPLVPEARLRRYARQRTGGPL